MKLLCTKCKYEFNLDDARVPASAAFKVKCPKCSEMIVARATAPPVKTHRAIVPDTDATSHGQEWERMKPFVEEYVSQRISQLRSELESFRVPQTGLQEPTPPGLLMKKALVCESNPKIEQAVSTALSRAGYRIESAKTTREALGKLDQEVFDLIATGPAFSDDPDGGNKIMDKMNARKFDERSRTFVVLLSPDLQTAGPENAFLHGANLTVNIRDLKELDRLIREGQIEFNKLSRTD